MDTENLIVEPIKKISAVYTEQITLKVCSEVKAMERELQSMQWDTAEVSRRAIKRAFQEALKLEMSESQP